MVHKVEITISGGAVQDVVCPRGVEVIIRDYDVEGVDESNTSWDIRRDAENDLYQRMEFRHPKDEAGSNTNMRSMGYKCSVRNRSISITESNFGGISRRVLRASVVFRDSLSG